jgi:Endosomal/lysosomal potassium channel TMEM175
MTLVVATLLPSIQAQKGTVFGLLSAIRGQLATVVISFAISARFWVSQQQRLAIASSITPPQIRLHLAFLFLIVLVPVSTSLDGPTGSGAGHDLWHASLIDCRGQSAALDRSSPRRRRACANCAIFAGARIVRRGAGARRDAARHRAIFLACRACHAAAGSDSRAAFRVLDRLMIVANVPSSQESSENIAESSVVPSKSGRGTTALACKIARFCLVALSLGRRHAWAGPVPAASHALQRVRRGGLACVICRFASFLIALAF